MSNRRFGLEIEFSGYSAGFNDALTAHMASIDQPYVNVEAYRRSAGMRWELKRDASCGFELASPAMCLDSWAAVQSVCTFLEHRRGIHVTQNCSVHVHHEARDYTGPRLRRLLKLWVPLEPLILQLVAVNRRHNYYCLPLSLLDATTTEGITRNIRGVRRFARERGRHVSLNLLPFWNRGTIEVRLHHGTFDSEDLLWWVSFTQGLMDVATVRLRNATIRDLYNTTFTERTQRLQHLFQRYAADSLWTAQSIEARHSKFNASARMFCAVPN